MTTSNVGKRTFRWDVFVSHNSNDKPKVRPIVQALVKAGLRVWFDERVIEAGDDIFAAVEDGLLNSKVLLLCMSDNAFASDWVQLERNTALFRDPTNTDRRFIPILLTPGAKIPDTIKRFKYIEVGDSEGVNEAVRACQSAAAVDDSVLPASHGLLDLHARRHRLDEAFTSITSDPNGEWIGWITPTGKLHVRKRSDGVVTTSRSFSSDAEARCIMTDAGECIYYANGAVERFSLVGEEQPWRVPHDGRIFSMSSFQGIVAIAARDGTLASFRTKNGEPRYRSTAEWANATNEVHWPVTSPWMLARNREGTHAWVQEWPKHRQIRLEVLDEATRITAASASVDAKLMLVGFDNSELHLYDRGKTRRQQLFAGTVLEGHAQAISRVLISPSGSKAFTRSRDPKDAGRVWALPSGELLGLVSETVDPIAFVDAENTLLCSTTDRREVIEIPVPRYSPSARDEDRLAVAASQTRYTNAKVVLVGESGVGKTAIANRLTKDLHVPTSSTHATDTWPLAVPPTSRVDIERELWLWDLAGQPDYRLTHQLLLDDTSVAVVVINPQDPDPLHPVADWVRSIDVATKRASRVTPKILVSGRVDRGGMLISDERLAAEMKALGITRHVPTSADTGLNCSDGLSGDGTSVLKQAILNAIPWDELPNIVTDKVIRRVKKVVVERATSGGDALLRFPELLQHVQRAFGDELVDVADVRKAIRLLANQHLLLPLDFGDLILLRASVMNGYAAAVTRAARNHPFQIGCVPEADVLEARIDFAGVERLDSDDEQLLLRALVKTFTERAICLAEETEEGRQLVFPSQFRRDRPGGSGRPVFLFADFAGELGSVFSVLVVKMWMATAFQNREIWQNAVEFESAPGQVVGFSIERRDVGGRINIFADAAAAQDSKVIFARCVQQHLERLASHVKWKQIFVCPKCGEPVRDQAAIDFKLERRAAYILCIFCEKKIPLSANLLTQFLKDPKLDQKATAVVAESEKKIDSQAKEQLLIGHMFAIAAEAGQIFRPTPMFDFGIDGEIEFKDGRGRASGKRVYVQLKSGDSYLRKRKSDNSLIFDVSDERHIDYWINHPADVYLVIRTSDGKILWMNVSAYFKDEANQRSRQIRFTGEAMDAFAIMRLRDRLIPRRDS